MSMLTANNEFPANYARMESLSNNPYADELIDIMDFIRNACKEGKFYTVVDELHEYNFEKLKSLGYDIEELPNEIGKSYKIKW